jgi:acetyl-CoA carboxylase carboxyl transferase subunit alpha
MGITADRLDKLGLVDEIVPEPLGGAHRDPEAMAETLKNALIAAVADLKALPKDQLVKRRRQRLAGVGVFKEG